MGKLPDPLWPDFSRSPSPIRILSDRGIRQAIEYGYLNIDPKIDLENLGDRLQPCTIDLKFHEVGSNFVPGTRKGEFLFDGKTLISGRSSWVEFQEAMSFNNPKGCYRGISFDTGFFGSFLDGRSSLLRLGAVILDAGASFYSGIESVIYNSSQNDIILEEGERICQLFIRVDPFADAYGIPYRGQAPRTEEGDKIRELEMGVQVLSDSSLEELSKKDYMKIERKNGRKYVPWKGLVLMHASKAFRTRKIEGGIRFADRGQYAKEDLLEEVDIRKKYEIREGEHLIVEVEETFDLSPYVGVSVLNNFMNNLIGQDVPGAPGPSGRSSFAPQKSTGNDLEDFRRTILNSALYKVRNSWIDPGYRGMMTGFPKLLGKTVQVGDVVGYGQVFYFPKGVERPYGSEELGSHYQGQDEFRMTSRT